MQTKAHSTLINRKTLLENDPIVSPHLFITLNNEASFSPLCLLLAEMLHGSYPK